MGTEASRRRTTAAALLMAAAAMWCRGTCGGQTLPAIDSAAEPAEQALRRQMNALDGQFDVLAMAGDFAGSADLCRREAKLIEAHPEYAARTRWAVELAEDRREADMFSAMAALDPAQQAKLAESRKLMREAEALEDQDRWKDAEAGYRKVLEIREALLGPDHTEIALALVGLARSLENQRKFSAAEASYRKALAIYQKTFREPPLNLMWWMSDLEGELAKDLRSQRKYGEAEAFDRAALDSCRRLFAQGTAGTKDSRIGDCLLGLAQDLDRQEKDPDAENCYREALAAYRKALGNRHSAVATALDSLAWMLFDRRRYAEAEPLLGEALAMRESLLAADDPLILSSRTHVGLNLVSLGRNDEAETILRGVLAARMHAPESLNAAVAMTNLGYPLREQGKYTEAEKLDREALAIRRRLLGNSNADVAASLQHLGADLRLQGRQAEAEPLDRESLGLARKLLGEKDPLVVKGLVRLASDLYARSDYVEAEKLDREALRLGKEILRPDDPELSASMSNLSRDLTAQGQMAEAEAIYREALETKRKFGGEEDPQVVSLMGNLAVLLGYEGKFQEAEQLQRDALRIERKRYGPYDRDVARTMNNLAITLCNQGHFAEAERISREALAVQLKLLGSENTVVATSMHNLAIDLAKQGRHVESELLNREALAIRRKLLGENHPDVAASFNNLAFDLAVKEDYQGAARSFASAVQIEKQLIERSAALVPEAQRQKLTGAYDPSADISGWCSLAFAHPEIADAASMSLACWAKSYLFDIAQGQQRLLQSQLAAGSLSRESQKTFRELLALRAQFAAFISSSIDDASSPADPSHDSKQPEERAERIKALAEKVDQADSRLRELNADYASHERQVHATIADLALRPNEAAIEFCRYDTLDARQGAFTTPRYGAFILSSSKPLCAVDIGPAKPIDAAIANYLALENRQAHSALGVGESEERDLAQAALPLRTLLWNKLAPLLPPPAAEPRFTRIYLAPDGLLCGFPFHALPRSADDLHYLAEQYEFVYISSSLDLARARFQQDAPASGSAIVLADPVFSETPEPLHAVNLAGTPAKQVADTAVLPSSPLAGSMAQRLIPQNWPEFGDIVSEPMRAITASLEAHHLAVRTPLTRRMASKTALFQSLLAEHPRILQFGTHGYLARPSATTAAVATHSPMSSPLFRSMLILAGANVRDHAPHFYLDSGGNLLPEDTARQLQQSDPSSVLDIQDNGLLTAYEVAGLNLQGTELVNLMACQTGVGNTISGEGMVGLGSAFMIAGAKSVTMSLWEVPSRESPLQFQDFFHHWLDDGQSRASAFHHAQLDALARARRRIGDAAHGCGHPLFWAGFIYFGDPGDLPLPPATAPSSSTQKGN